MSERGTESEEQRRHASQRSAVRTAAALVLVVGAAIAAAITFASVEVCDRQPTQAGEVVTACRHLQATDPPVVAGLLVIVLAVVLLIDLGEVAFMGVTMKRNLADAQSAAESAQRAQDGAQRAEANAADAALSSEQAAKGAQVSADSAELAQSVAQTATTNAEEAAKSARQAGLHASGAYESASKIQELVSAQQARHSPRDGEARDIEEQTRALAQEYMRVRKARDPGDQRTAEMTAVVADMIALYSSPNAAVAGELTAWLRDDSPGIRLAAYAYLYSHPDAEMLDQIAAAALKEDKPFTQYWALRALRQQVESGHDLGRHWRKEFEALIKRVGASTDRGYEARQILQLS